jgi:hypothetical protein
MATYTKTYTFANGSTADGGQVNTEVVNLGTSVNDITDAQINSSANIAISKTALGTYTVPTSWTPTITFVGPGTDDGSGKYTYTQIGKTVFCTGYTGLIGNSPTQVQLTLPVVLNTTFLGNNRALGGGGRLAVGGNLDAVTYVYNSGGTGYIYLETNTGGAIAGGAWISFSVWFPTT